MQLKEQKKALEGRLQERQSDMAARLQELATKNMEQEQSCAKQVEESKEAVAAKEMVITSLRREMDISSNETQALRRELLSLKESSAEMRNQLEATKQPSNMHQRELAKLRSEVDEARRELELESGRAKSIVVRYEKGNLVSVPDIEWRAFLRLVVYQTSEERRLIEIVHFAAQSTHERELVEKSNEIRRVGSPFRIISNWTG